MQILILDIRFTLLFRHMILLLCLLSFLLLIGQARLVKLLDQLIVIKLLPVLMHLFGVLREGCFFIIIVYLIQLLSQYIVGR